MERNTLRQEVASRVVAAVPAVEAQVLDHLIQQEVDKRANLIIAGLEKLTGYEKELAKLKPDLVTYAEDGTETSSAYSKGRIDERNKLKGRIDKLGKALDKALGGDIGDLSNAVKDG